MTSPADAADPLDARYGGHVPEGDLPRNPVLDLLYRHRSVRRYTEAPVTEEQTTAIIAAAQSGSTSSNFQTWSVIEVHDPVRRARLAELADNQRFIERAPLFLVFVADWARNREIARRHEAPTAAIDYIESTVVGFVDAAIAAQNAVVAAESLGLGAVFVGSIRNNPLEVAELLRLPEGTFPTFGMAIGHPDPADRAGIRPRLPQPAVRHREVYAPAEPAHIDAYDAALEAYFDGQGRPGHTWTPTVLGRVRDASSLRGRDTLRQSLTAQGLPSD